MSGKSAPIGMFDSGFGGLSVLSQVHRLLPNEHVVYFGDNARAPYGGRPPEDIVRFNHEIVEFLLEHEVKAILMACNTSSSISLAANQQRFSVPFISLIEHGLNGLGHMTRTGSVTVLATEGTVKSGSFRKAIASREPGLNIAEVACPRFVPLIENNMIRDAETRNVAQEYLNQAGSAHSDVIIFGCTHYPFLQPVLEGILGNGTQYLNPAIGAVRYAREYLEQAGLLNDTDKEGTYTIYTSGDSGYFKERGEQLLGFPLENVYHKKF